MDEEDRQRGLAHIRAIRSQLVSGAEPPAVFPSEDTSSQKSSAHCDDDRYRHDAIEADALDNPAHMAAQMAAGAEREELRRQVERLEAENVRLRQVLAQMLKLAATGVEPGDADYEAMSRRPE